MNDLLPCPFCGGKAEILTAKSIRGENLYGVMCNCCTGRTDVFDSKDGAIDSWNSRYHFGLTDENYKILFDELRISKRTCHIEYPYYGDAPVINGQQRCSECKAEFAVGTFPNYCPNCGAKVVGE